MHPNLQIAFIGGGNMAQAIVGGLLKRGMTAAQITVVEPFAATAQALRSRFKLSQVQSSASEALSKATLVVWAVKPQTFAEAAEQAKPHLNPDALHLSVAAGIRSDTIAEWLGTERIVRAMPNTPALIGQGISGLYARVPEDAPMTITAEDLGTIEALIDTTGSFVWVREEKQLDAVTALSGSGPAYVFYFLESLIRAGEEMDLDAETAKQLALHTFKGATALALASSDDLATLRERVTSKGGTTYAALQAFAAAKVDEGIAQGVHAAAQRAKELGDAFGA